MFKKYIENHPDSQLSYLYKQHLHFDKIRQKLLKKSSLIWKIYFNSTISLAIGAVIFLILSSLLPSFFYISQLLLMTGVFSQFLIIPFSDRSTQLNISNKYDIFLKELNVIFNDKDNIKKLFDELQEIQEGVKLKALEQLIFELKIIYLEDKGMHRGYVTKLMNFLYKNYEELKDSNNLSNDELNIFGYEKEIEIFGAKKIL